MKKNRKIYYCSPHISDPNGYGGARRNAQVKDILMRFFPDVIELKTDVLYSSKFKKILTGVKSAQRIIKAPNLKAIKNIIHTDILINYHLDKFSDLRDNILICEGYCPSNWFLVEVTRKLNCKFIVFPQNLESLVPLSKSIQTGKQSPDWFQEELTALQKCDGVFTISREEQWLLGLYGLESGFMPYFPLAEAQKELLSIRDKRTKTPEIVENNSFLCIASAHYYPTYLGMKSLIELFESSPISAKLLIGGFGSEVLSSCITSSKVELVGQLSQDKINDLHTRVKAVIINQPYSTGALTKIPETLISGVPIILNHQSARSYHGTDGLHIFESKTDFHRILTENLPVPKIYEAPKVFEETMIEEISKFR